MTKTEFIKKILSSFDEVAQEVPCTSGPGMVKKISFTKSAFELLLYAILKDEHVVWKENGNKS